MKKLRLILTAAVLFAAAAGARADSSVPVNLDWRFGLLASYDNVDAVFVADGSSYDINSTHCFSVGPIVSFDIIDYFSLQSGLYFSMYQFITGTSGAYMYNFSPGLVVAEEKTTLYNLTLPLYGVAKLPVREVGILLEAGPLFTCGLAGNIRTRILESDVSGTYEYVYDSKPYDHLKRFNCAIHLGVGAEFKGARVMVGYNIGVFNIARSSNRDIRVGGFTISASYLF